MKKGDDLFIDDIMSMSDEAILAEFRAGGGDPDRLTKETLSIFDRACLIVALRDYLKAQCAMLEKWADGDDSVKHTLWGNLHACEASARRILERLQQV